MVKKVSSIEVADLLVRNRDYMTVAEVTRLVEAKYPHLLVNPGIITNILRSFVRSPFAQCCVHPDAYPRQYRLDALKGYTFKARGRPDIDYDSLVVTSATKRRLQSKEMELRSVCVMARELMDRCMRGRIENTPLM
ncbi:late promoter activating protein [Pantoea eucrina]|uniref:Late promoter activating protein n=1 Tax=Pantoea eucrina TaxID=472693 RepID=A0ABS1Z9E6_9GAMM|nr:hypothetical protein [Pantoea eucrina]MBM0748948.1 late promoter activating protein [Pantoea eucrina]QNH53368.1 late promoter activating protein [Acinetobacter venetianus]